MDALQEVLNGLDKNQTPAEWVAWFGKAMQALISALSALFKKLTGKGEETTTEAQG